MAHSALRVRVLSPSCRLSCQAFEWTLPAPDAGAGAAEERSLVVMVYDKDQFSADDVIGCVELPLRAVLAGAVDSWLPVRRPGRPRRRGLWARLRGALLGRDLRPELKLRVSGRLAGGGDGDGGTVDAGELEECKMGGEGEEGGGSLGAESEIKAGAFLADDARAGTAAARF